MDEPVHLFQSLAALKGQNMHGSVDITLNRDSCALELAADANRLGSGCPVKQPVSDSATPSAGTKLCFTAQRFTYCAINF